MLKSRKNRQLVQAAIAGVEALESRMLLSGNSSIAGTIYNDINANGVIDGDVGLAGRQVYLDLQGIDTFVSGDPITVADASGNYSFAGLAAGNYLVRLLPVAGHVTTSPVWGGKYFVQLGASQAVTGDNFLDSTPTGPKLLLTNGQLLVASIGGASGSISRFNADTSVDTNYGTLGKMTISGVSGVAQSMTNLPDGTISVVFASQIVTLSSTGALISVAPNNGGGGTVTINAPTALTAAATSSTSVHLTFTDNSTNEQGFTVERSSSASGPWVSVGSVAATATTGTRALDDNSAAAGTTYFYRVYATSGSSQSTFAGPVSATTPGGVVVTSGSTLTGTLFNDANGNGTRDAGDNGVVGKQVYLDLQGLDAFVSGDPIVTTDASGKYTFTGLSAGNYLIRPLPVSGQAITSPVWGGKYFVQLGTNQTISGEDFGIESPAVTFTVNGQLIVAGTSGSQATISRFLADGSSDVSFGYLGGVTLPASVTGTPTAAVASGSNLVITFPTQIVTLNSTGGVVSIVANGGGTPVTITAPSSLAAVAASATTVNLSFTDNSTNEQSFTIERSTSSSGPWSTVATVAGTTTTGTRTATDTTASASTTYFYRVYGVSGATQSSVNGPVSATTPAATVNTGGIISGTVYYDANGNGSHDSGEAGVVGHGLYLDLQGLGHYVAGDPTATTDANGNYAFTGLQPANYLVHLTAQAGDTLTFPYPQYGGLYFVGLAANQTAGGKDFGLVPQGTVTPPTTHLSVGANVDTSKVTGSESTAQIAINPTNANNVVIVSQSGDNNGDLLPLSRSFDGGKTWTTQMVGGQDGLSTSTPRPDAHVAFDSFGNLYLTYMVAASQTEIRVVVLRSTDGGASFTTLGAPVSGSFSPDSPWIATGPSTTVGGAQAVWISFTDYTSNRVLLVGGTSNGLGQFSGWGAAKTVSQSFGTYSSVAVNSNGALAVSWQSTDAGTIVANKLEINYDSSGTGNHFSADTLMATTNIGGYDPIPAQPDRTIDAEARIAFDRSSDSTNGRLYMVYTDLPAASGNNTDIFLKYSDNLGATWSSGIKVNDDATSNSQFIPAIAVDQTTGNVGLSWLDARNSAANNTVELFATVSLDHGLSVQPNVQVASALSNQAGANPNSNDLDFGDNGGVAFNAGKLLPVWSDNTNVTGNNPNGTGKALDVYTAIVTVS